MNTPTTEELLKRATLNVVTPLSDETLRRFLEAHHIARHKTDFAGASYNTLGALNSAAWAGENLHFIFAELVRLRRMAASWEAMREALEQCDKAFVCWQVGQIPGRPEEILALIVDLRRALALSNGKETTQ